MGEPEELTVPFRWDLVSPDQLGSLLEGAREPDLWFLDCLVACAGEVLARAGDGDLFFVGRSLDSMFDLLSGALSGVAAAPRMHRLPLSFARNGVPVGSRWQPRPLSDAERRQARRILAADGLDPRALARRARPAAFADVVDGGSTFTELFTLLRDWIAEDGAQWDVIRRKLRFIGVTVRRATSPNTFRWQQHAAWTRLLPARAVRNVSLDWPAWTYLADRQVKLTRSFTPDRWLADAAGPGHGEPTRQALAEAVALVAYGRSPAGRTGLAQAVAGEPGLAEPWLRSLVTDLSRRR
jgi:hypothetical protein